MIFFTWSRKMASYTSFHSKNPCYVCKLPYIRNDERNGPDFSNFNPQLPRTKAENIEYAYKWKNATTEKERQDIEDSSGVRYSELYR